MKATGPSDEGGKSVSAKASKPEQPATVRRTHRHSRRAFLSRTGGLGVATWSASALGLNLLAPPPAHAAASTGGDHQRVTQCFSLRREAALRDRNLGTPPHVGNGDEATHPNRIGNYSKGLPHNSIGEVDLAAYDSLVRAVTTGDPSDFENVTLGGNTPLVNPQAGLAFDMEGLDAYQFAIPPAPALASAERAGEAVECYWMALLRDVNFTQYDSHALALQAAAELSTLSDFRGPKVNGQVTPATLFRGSAAGDLVGPHVSQFLLQPLGYGVLTIDQKFNTYLAGLDYLTTPAAWLSVRNGNSPSLLGSMDPVLRYARNGRDLAAYVHVDVLFEAYFNACLWLLNHGAPLSLGNPYRNSQNQTGFGTFGAPHIATLVAEVSTRALKAVWYQKWFVHRALRPEEYGGLVHFTRTGQANHPLHPEALNSAAIDLTYSRFGSYLLPMAFPEGCPQHPAYGAGHATVAGACTTILKAFFDGSWVIPNPVVASDDGLSLLPYIGADAGQLTVAGELNKVAANVSVGRNHAGVHWRSDYWESLLLGEQVAISILRDQRKCYNEPFAGFTFAGFRGNTITV